MLLYLFMTSLSPSLFFTQLLYLIKDNEEKIKTREKGILHSNIIHWRLILIILRRGRRGRERRREGGRRGKEGGKRKWREDGREKERTLIQTIVKKLHKVGVVRLILDLPSHRQD